MTNNELFAIVRQIVMIVTGLDDDHVVIRDPNIGSPGGEYCAIAVDGPSRRFAKGGYKLANIGPVQSPIGDVYDVGQQVRQTVLRDVSINFYRGNANDHAVKILGAKQRFDVHNILLANGIGWISAGPVNDLTALQSNRHETRAEVSATFATLETQDVVSNAIYTVPADVQNESGVSIASQTIESPTE